MPLFKRKDKTTIAELEEYYANQSKNRTSKAWLMALLSLLITFAVLAALFFGGRWLYQLVTDGDNVVVTTTGEQQGGVPPFGEIRTEEDADNSAGDTDQGSDSDAATNNDASSENEGVVSEEAATTTRDDAGTNADSTTDSSTQDENIVSTTEIPNTGANELIALLPLVALTAGYLFSRNRQLNK